VIVEELCRFTVRKNSNQLIAGLTTVSENVLLRGPLTVGSGLNGVNVEGFYRSVVKVDESANLKGIKKFKIYFRNSSGEVYNRWTKYRSLIQ
jgi:hypothetical protein